MGTACRSDSSTATVRTPAATAIGILVTDPDGNDVTGGTATITVASSGAPTGLRADGASTRAPRCTGRSNETTGRPRTSPRRLQRRHAEHRRHPRYRGRDRRRCGDDLQRHRRRRPRGVRARSRRPHTFTAQAWFKTTSTGGGRILGLLRPADRHLRAPRPADLAQQRPDRSTSACTDSAPTTVTSSRTYNDGVWHQAVASLGPSGMALYIDGVRVGQRSDVTAAEKYVGTWRIGGDSLAGWASGNATSTAPSTRCPSTRPC